MNVKSVVSFWLVEANACLYVEFLTSFLIVAFNIVIIILNDFYTQLDILHRIVYVVVAPLL